MSGKYTASLSFASPSFAFKSKVQLLQVEVAWGDAAWWIELSSFGFTNLEQSSKKEENPWKNK